MKKYFSNKKFFAGFAMATLFFLFVILGFFAMPHSPTKIDSAKKNMFFCAEHILGTDHLGRDILSRLMLASRISFLTGLCATLFGIFAGTIAGSLAGFFGGVLDAVLSKGADILLAFPGILLALVFACVYGAKIQVMIFALCVMSVPRFFRIARSGFKKYRASHFVLASFARGANSFRIMTRHILPNIASDLFVTAALNFSISVLSEAALSYLGLGVQPPLASFGKMLGDAQRFILTAPHSIFVPAAALVILSLGFNLLGEGVMQVNEGR